MQKMKAVLKIKVKMIIEAILRVKKREIIVKK
jgi:hypothetical protein